MYFEPLVRPATGAPVLPRPRDTVMRKLSNLADIIGGPVDNQPERLDGRLGGTLILPEAGLLLATTTCHRPLCFSETRDLAYMTDLDVVLLRFDAHRLSFDIYAPQARALLIHYQRWQREGDPWFVPAVGRGPYVRATSQGLEIGDVAPFIANSDRAAGLADQIQFALAWGA